MQIQRIQTVYIFLAFVAMVIFIFVPYGQVVAVDGEAVTGETLLVMKEWGILIPVAVAAVLLLVDIFLYRDLKLQRKTLVISLMLTLAVIATVCFALYKQGDSEAINAHFSPWDIMLPFAALMEIMGVKAINSDIKLLNSYNRLR